MTTRYILIITTLLFVVTFVTSQQNQCIKLTTSLCGEEDQNVAAVSKHVRGSPGKSGPPGPTGRPGPVGQKGEPGESVAFNSSPLDTEVSKLKRRLRFAEGLLSVFERVPVDNIRVKLCGVGMQDYRVQPAQLSASSSWAGNSIYGANFGRLFGSLHGGGLLASGNRAGEWYQVDLLKDTTLYGVATQGRYSDSYPQWVTSYTVSHKCSDCDDFTFVTVPSTKHRVTFTGNDDQNTVVVNNFDQPITARYFRINPLTWHHHISYRAEWLLC